MLKALRAIVIINTIVGIYVIVTWPQALSGDPKPEAIMAAKTPEELDLEHRQETWISSLEWCESRGRNDALNKMDRDGTPSYSNFQWKPTTFLYYGKMYGHIATSTQLSDVPALLKDYELQRAIVRSMVKDIHTDFFQQFPDCVKLKVGLPPRK